MDTSHPTEIALSRPKTVMLLLLGLGLAALGISLLLRAPEIAEKIPFVGLIGAYIVGVVCVGFFGGATAFSEWRLLHPTPGLRLDARGITDQTSAVGAGFIPWADVSGTETGATLGQQIVYVVLQDPDAFLRRVPPIRRAAMAQNARIGASPVALTAGTLDTGFDEMAALVRAYHAARGPRRA